MAPFDRKVKQSGRKSALDGSTKCVGLTIKPEQILQLLHDTQPNSPIPFDAILCAIQIEDGGSQSWINFFFNSLISPTATNVSVNPHELLKILVGLSDGMLPSDTELRGIEISTLFNLLLFVVRSDKFPQGLNSLPIASLRYVAGELILYHPAESLKGEKRIKISDKR